MTGRELAILPLIEPGEGADLLLTLIRAGGSRVSLILGPAEAVAVAGDLIQEARIRFGRGTWPQESISESLGSIGVSSSAAEERLCGPLAETGMRPAPGPREVLP
jgi:hypothetical protein